MKEKKIKTSITIDANVFKQLNDENINKSKLINWLIMNHYDTISIDKGCVVK